jgi:hypothetical protein
MKNQKQPWSDYCGAKTRNGELCQNQPERGKKRCHLHGGANGIGAPIGNTNALKSGLHTTSVREIKKRVRSLCHQARQITKTNHKF